MIGIRITDAEARRTVPKWGFTREDLEFAIGSPDLVTRMIKAGWIVPRCKRPSLYDSGDAARCWARIIRGEEP